MIGSFATDFYFFNVMEEDKSHTVVADDAVANVDSDVSKEVERRVLRKTDMVVLPMV